MGLLSSFFDPTSDSTASGGYTGMLGGSAPSAGVQGAFQNPLLMAGLGSLAALANRPRYVRDPSQITNPLGAVLSGAVHGGQMANQNRIAGAQGALLNQEYQKNVLGNAQMMARMRFMAQRHPEMFPPGMLDQMNRLAGLPSSGSPNASSSPAPSGLLGGPAAPSAAPADAAGASAMPPATADYPSASASGGLFDPRMEGNLLDAQFMGIPPEVMAMAPGLQRQKFLASNGYLPNGQIDPRYVSGQGSLEASKAAGAAPYKALEALLSRAGQVHNIGPGEVGVTGFQTMPPGIQSLVTQMLHGNALPGAGGMPSAAPQRSSAAPTSIPSAAGGVGTNQTGFPTQSMRGPGGSFQNPITLEGKTLQTEVLPAQFKQAATNYNAAQDVSSRLDMMDHAIDQLNQANWSSTGTGADMKLGAMKALNSVATTLGASPFVDPQKIGTWEDFNKESTRMGFELAKTLGSREAMMIVQQATAAVPNANNTYLGAKLVSSSLRQAAQRQEDYYEYLNGYAQSHGGNTMGADVAFNKAHPPKEYTSRAIVNAIPQGAVQALQADPKLAGQFDTKYGPGVSGYVLGGK